MKVQVHLQLSVHLSSLIFHLSVFELLVFVGQKQYCEL